MKEHEFAFIENEKEKEKEKMEESEKEKMIKEREEEERKKEEKNHNSTHPLIHMSFMPPSSIHPRHCSLSLTLSLSAHPSTPKIFSFQFLSALPGGVEAAVLPC